VEKLGTAPGIAVTGTAQSNSMLSVLPGSNDVLACGLVMAPYPTGGLPVSVIVSGAVPELMTHK
jgi:hypothetical protein